MKNKEKKTPKLNANEYILSSDAEAILYGLILVLISLIGFLNYGIIGEALTYIFAYLFGIFYIFIYLLLLFFGIYLMVKKTFYRLHIDLKILGAILLVFGFCIAASMENNISINNFFTSYQNQVNNTQNRIFSMSSTDAIYANLGGGIIGYLFVGLLNSSITETGTCIVVASFVSLGLILLFKDLIIRFFKFIINYHKKRKELRKENNLKLQEQEKQAKQEENDKLIEENKILSTEDKIDNRLTIDEYSAPKREKASTIIKNLSDDENNDDNNLFFDEDKITPISRTNKPLESEYKPCKSEFDENNYSLPPISLLKDRFNADESSRKIALANERLEKINSCFKDLGIGASAISYTIGPSVTRFDIKMNPNVKTNVLCSIENDLAVRLGGNKTVRLETIVEGKDTSGIEIGNEISDVVSFKECMREVNKNTKDRLLFPLGKNISGDIISCRLDEMPHLLVCGTTGSGKSVFVHNIIVSLLMRNRPDQLKLMLIDPKRVEFTKYQNIPHLLCPIINSPDKAKIGLMKLTEEMERRYELFASKGRGASNYKEYMEICDEMGYEKIPYIVLICDEFADFIEGDRENAKLIQRIAQMARACGIYMVIATQRPSVKVITGDIKANIPSRIALSVSTQIDSRTIIDEPGAENLMGKGDLLAKVPNHKSIIRVQSAYIDNREIYEVCEYCRSQAPVKYDPNFEDLTPKVVTPYEMANSGLGDPSMMYKDFHTDEKYEEIKKFVIATGKCSTTKLQNTFGIGFSRADGILDTLEKDGIIKREGNKRVLSSEYQQLLDDEDE